MAAMLSRDGGNTPARASARVGPLPGHRAERQPEEIAAQRLPWRLRGVHPAEARGAMLTAAAGVDRVKAALAQAVIERAMLEKAVASAKQDVKDLQERLVATHAALAVCQEQERCGALAEATIREARVAALVALRCARAAAEIIARLPDLLAAIHPGADEPAPGTPGGECRAGRRC